MVEGKIYLLVHYSRVFYTLCWLKMYLLLVLADFC